MHNGSYFEKAATPITGQISRGPIAKIFLMTCPNLSAKFHASIIKSTIPSYFVPYLL